MHVCTVCVWNYTRGKVLRVQFVQLAYPNSCHKSGFILMCYKPGGVLPYSLGGDVPLGSWKSYPLLEQILQILWSYTRPKMLNCFWFQSFVSDPVTRDPILDQFSMITRPYIYIPDQMVWKPYPLPDQMVWKPYPLPDQMAWKPYLLQWHIPV